MTVNCCHYRNQALRYITVTRDARRSLCGEIETLHGKVERVGDGSSSLTSHGVDVRSSAEEYLGTCAGRYSPPHV